MLDLELENSLGRPVLIGTTNVENSEIIAELLDASGTKFSHNSTQRVAVCRLGVTYQLLNAKPENVARETEIVAGQCGALFQVHALHLKCPLYLLQAVAACTESRSPPTWQA